MKDGRMKDFQRVQESRIGEEKVGRRLQNGDQCFIWCQNMTTGICILKWGTNLGFIEDVCIKGIATYSIPYLGLTEPIKGISGSSEGCLPARNSLPRFWSESACDENFTEAINGDRKRHYVLFLLETRTERFIDRYMD